MSKIRVLIVDDAVVVRRIVSDVLSADPEIEVVGTAANGKLGLAKIELLKPDLVTMDIEMPEMDGLETLAALRKINRRLPVIMFSTLTQRGAATTLEALTLGANDYVTKPANVGSVAAAQQSLRDQLVPKIKALVNRFRPGPLAAKLPVKPHAPLVMRPLSKVEIVAIGVSTGGPNALCEVLLKIPANFPVPIVIVQHMPPMFTRLLAERLDKQSLIGVHEAEIGTRLQAGHAYLAPGDFHMIVKRDGTDVVLALHQGPPENSCRPAVDVLFRSVVEVYKASTLGVIMTGMGQDGLHGCEAIRAANGQILAQDEETSVVWGMPGFVARAGLADNILPLGEITAGITSRVMKGRMGATSNELLTAN
ncbi:protein-glutamate methylesterase/protein-glutamine glutaminase [Schlesneria paludicola]|uniref:protein-glutamate methylesterase/protein-glutamine glutaminase n=1 Tax=Schlesneria paludicola TaxID=360056 RepID=UPI000299FB38|nr:chemotaxis response regulator protein-glutamate methylesterase [Schlesneria paludicola]